MSGFHKLFVGDDASGDSEDDSEQYEANLAAKFFSEDGVVADDIAQMPASDFLAAAVAAVFPLQLFLRAAKVRFDAPPITAATRVFSLDVDSVNACFLPPPLGEALSAADAAAAAAVAADRLGPATAGAIPLAVGMRNVTRVLLSRPKSAFATGCAAGDLLARLATVFCAGQSSPTFLYLVMPRSAVGGGVIPECIRSIRCQDDLVRYAKACVLRAEALIRSADALHPLSVYASSSLFAAPHLQDYVVGSFDHSRISLALLVRALAIVMEDAFEHVFLMLDSFAVKFLPNFSTISCVSANVYVCNSFYLFALIIVFNFCSFILQK